MNVKNLMNLYTITINLKEISNFYKLDKFYRINSSNNKTKKKDSKKNINKENNINNNKEISEIEHEPEIDIINKNNIMKKFIVYKSNIITKIELSIEILYNFYIQINNKKTNYNQKFKNMKQNKNSIIKDKLFFNLIFELIKSGVKIKEFYSLYKINIPFYTEEENFYTYYLGINKEKYISNIIHNENINNYILPYRGNLFIPINNNDLNSNTNLINSSYRNKFLSELLEEEENQRILDNKKKLKISRLHFLGEILYLLRPAIYLSLLSIFRENTIIPLIINIVIDILIYLSRMEITQENFKEYGINFLVQKLNFYEMRLRNKKFFLYFLREPIFSSFIKPLVVKIFDIIFLPKFIKNSILSLLEYYTNYSYIA